jgi:hypothetical protein
MNLENVIKECFPTGMKYNEAAQLCLLLYVRKIDALPEAIQKECNKDNLAKVFSSLSSKGFIVSEPLEASLYGANFHSVKEKGHWIEVIASIFKNHGTLNNELSERLYTSLTRNLCSLQSRLDAANDAAPHN